MGRHLGYTKHGGEKQFFFFLNGESGKEIKNSVLDILSLKHLKDIKRRCGVRS